MSSPKVQSQPSMSVPGLLHPFGTDVPCAELLKRVLGPEVFRCPRGVDARQFPVGQGFSNLFQCIGCRCDALLSAGRMVQRSKLPLISGRVATHPICKAKTEISGLSRRHRLDVTNPAAWLLHHQINRTMADREAARLLKGVVQLDDAYILCGGCSGCFEGIGSQGKAPLAASLSLDENDGPTHLNLELVSDLSSHPIGRCAKARLKHSCVVLSDDRGCFAAVIDAECIHILGMMGIHKPTHLPRFNWVNTELDSGRPMRPALSTRCNSASAARPPWVASTTGPTVESHCTVR